MSDGHPRSRQEAGFTLVEILVGLVVSSLLLVSLNMVMGTLNQSLDKTSTAAARQSMLSTALDTIGSDIARIERFRAGADGSGAYLFSGAAGSVAYVLAERPGTGPAGLYAVRLSVRDAAGGSELVRERAALEPGASALPESGWSDPVVLLNGPYGIGFAYRAPQAGMRNWVDGWTAGTAMPEQVQLTITDLPTGRLRVPVFVQSLRIDAETACVAPKAKGCSLAPGEAQQ